MCRKIFYFILFVLAFAHTIAVRADWSMAEASNRTDIYSPLSQSQQHIIIKYPEENYVGWYNDGIYNVCISTPDGHVFYKKNPNNNTMTQGGYGYKCYSYTADEEENSSSSGTDTRYRYVVICMKPFTSETEYKNFSVTISYDLYIDKTADDATPKTQYHVSKTFTYDFLSLEPLKYYDISSKEFIYENGYGYFNFYCTSDNNPWQPCLRIRDTGGTNQETFYVHNPFIYDLVSYNIEDLDVNDDSRRLVVTPAAFKDFKVGNITYYRYYYSDRTIGLFTCRKYPANLKVSSASNGVRLTWGESTGNPGGKVIIRRKKHKDADYTTIAEINDDNVSYLDTAVDPATFFGYYSIVFKGPYEKTPYYDRACTAFYSGSSVAYCQLKGDVVTYYYNKAPDGNFDDIKLLNEEKAPWEKKATKAVIDPSFDAYQPTDLHAMFKNLLSITTIEGMQYLHTENVTDMSYMFWACKGLTTLDLTNFNTSKVTKILEMFSQCENLRTIYASDNFVTKAISSGYQSMFLGCTNLKGAVEYDYKSINYSMANCDNGYLIRKIKGDINLDGKLNIADLTSMISVLLGKANAWLGNTDLTGDGRVNLRDATWILDMLLDREPQAPNIPIDRPIVINPGDVIEIPVNP